MSPSPSFLERLREKPEAVRARYLFLSVGISFAGIAILWVFSLKTSLGAMLESGASREVQERVHTLTENAPVSLDELMKTGETLMNKGKQLQQEASSEGSTPSQPPPANEPENSDPKLEDTSEENAAIRAQEKPREQNEISPQENAAKALPQTP